VNRQEAGEQHLLFAEEQRRHLREAYKRLGEDWTLIRLGQTAWGLISSVMVFDADFEKVRLLLEPPVVQKAKQLLTAELWCVSVVDDLTDEVVQRHYSHTFEAAVQTCDGLQHRCTVLHGTRITEGNLVQEKHGR